MPSGFSAAQVKAIIIVITLIGSVTLTSASPLDTGLEGWWLDGSGRAGIRLSACGSKICGFIRWLRDPLDADGKRRADIANTNPSLRTRSICGLQILGNFVPDGQGHWSGGWIYNPNDGNTYRSTMELASDGTLHVRGYVGVSLFGKSEIWTRPSANLQSCS